MAQSGSETGGSSKDLVSEVDSLNPVHQEEEKGVLVMSAIDPEEGLGLHMAGLGGDKNEMGWRKGRRKRSIDEESSLVAKKNPKPSDEVLNANINSKLPPELLSVIFSFLPFSDLKKALLVCRWMQIQFNTLFTVFY